MHLTSQDLQAIKQIVDDKIDESNQITAAALADVYRRLDGIDGRFDGIDNRLDRMEAGQTLMRQDMGALQLAVGRLEFQQSN